MSPAKASRDKWQARWRSLSGREQRLILVMALLMAICGLYYGVWIPLTHELAQATHSYQQEWELLQWIEVNQGEAPDNDLKSAPLSDLLARTAKENNLAIAHSEPSDEGAITLTLEQAPFNQMILWIDKLQRRYQVTLLSVSVTRADAGVVNATLQIKR